MDARGTVSGGITPVESIGMQLCGLRLLSHLPITPEFEPMYLHAYFGNNASDPGLSPGHTFVSIVVAEIGSYLGCPSGENSLGDAAIHRFALATERIALIHHLASRPSWLPVVVGVIKAVLARANMLVNALVSQLKENSMALQGSVPQGESDGLVGCLCVLGGHYDGVAPGVKANYQANASDSVRVTVISCPTEHTQVQSIVKESPHSPYRNDTDEMIELSIPGATQLTITFDDKCCTESGHDYVRFYRDRDRSHCVSEKYSGSSGWPGAEGNAPLVLSGDTCFMHWYTDGSECDYWGWRVAVAGHINIIQEPEPSEIPFSSLRRIAALPVLAYSDFPVASSEPAVAFSLFRGSIVEIYEENGCWGKVEYPQSSQTQATGTGAIEERIDRFYGECSVHASKQYFVQNALLSTTRVVLWLGAHNPEQLNATCKKNLLSLISNDDATASKLQHVNSQLRDKYGHDLDTLPGDAVYRYYFGIVICFPLASWNACFCPRRSRRCDRFICFQNERIRCSIRHGRIRQVPREAQDRSSMRGDRKASR
jgi:hypothetical protein